jgi:transcriptional regulator with XRE-family HTH domain
MTDIQTTNELAQLNELRLEEGLTYEALAEMVGIEASTLHRALRHPDRRPYDRTLHKIRRFLDEQKAIAAPGKRRARA